MLKDITIGQYYKEDSDPQTRSESEIICSLDLRHYIIYA